MRDGTGMEGAGANEFNGSEVMERALTAKRTGSHCTVPPRGRRVRGDQLIPLFSEVKLKEQRTRALSGTLKMFLAHVRKIHALT